MIDIDLTGRVALVTGGGRGLGLDMAVALGRCGARIGIVGRGQTSLDTASARLQAMGIDVIAIAADVTVSQDVDRIVATMVSWGGCVDIIVNNAGIADEAGIDHITREGWDSVIAINLTAPMVVSQRCLPHMARGSAIINISSIDANGCDGPFSSYMASKAGLIGFTKTIAVELAPRGIRVNTVSPGYSVTEMVVDAIGPELVEYMTSKFDRVPMGRSVTGEEVANAVVFLASDLASGITGTDLIVDGGTLANLYILETLPAVSPTDEDPS
jgi:NAD(P)-dependent dehydrogenase (short-subunit alcohol dehydrogenase family)